MSKIEWTEKTWNVSTGCNKVSEGCKHCYAEVMHKRQMVLNPEKYAHPFLDGAFPHEASLEAPLRWKKPAMIFVNSMSDLFHENIPFEFIYKVYKVIEKCEKHTFQILTKRPERAKEFYYWLMQYPFYQQRSFAEWFHNVLIGTSVENQEQADKRIPYLLQIPAAVRFLSCEPLLSEVDLRLPVKVWIDANGDKRCDHCCNKDRCDEPGHYYRPECPYCRGTGKGTLLHWVNVGGESGHGARPLHPDWARKIRDDCQAARVAFFFKQWGEYLPQTEWENMQLQPLPTNGIFQYRNGDIKKYSYDSWNAIHFEPSIIMAYEKLGKKHTGRLLDGLEYSEYPNSEIVKGEVVK